MDKKSEALGPKSHHPPMTSSPNPQQQHSNQTIVNSPSNISVSDNRKSSETVTSSEEVCNQQPSESSEASDHSSKESVAEASSALAVTLGEDEEGVVIPIESSTQLLDAAPKLPESSSDIATADTSNLVREKTPDKESHTKETVKSDDEQQETKKVNCLNLLLNQLVKMNFFCLQSLVDYEGGDSEESEEETTDEPANKKARMA